MSLENSFGGWALDGYFFQPAQLSCDLKQAIGTIWLGSPNQSYSHFPDVFWNSYEYLFQYQSEDSCPY